MLIVNEPLSELNEESEYSFLLGVVLVGAQPEPVIPAISNLLFDDNPFWNWISSVPILNVTEPLLCSNEDTALCEVALKVWLLFVSCNETPSNFLTGDIDILSTNCEPNSSEPLNSYVVFPVPNE